jgi:hypothetical protein
MKKLNPRDFTIMLIVTALIVASLGVLTPKAFPQAIYTKLYIDPPEIINPSLGPGSTFFVNATVFNVTDLFTWQVQVKYDPSILNCTYAEIPATSKFNFPVQPGTFIDNDNGLVTSGASLISTPGANGSDTLLHIQFEVVGRGYSYINYSQPGIQTFLLDSRLRDIAYTIENGEFYNWVAPPPAKLYINPPRVVDPLLVAGSRFNVSLSIENATGIFSWKSKVYYDKTILNATDVFEGAFLKSAGSTIFYFEIQQDYNATHGLIDMNCTLTAAGGANDAGELAIITFEVLGLGQSDITISEADLRDESNNALSFNKFDGYFNNILVAKLSIEPSEVSGPEYTIGTNFTINVTLDDVESLKKCVFNLTYVPSVIVEINIYIPQVLGQTPTKKLQVDDYAGYIWAELTYPNQITTYNPVTIMQVQFEVVSMGISPINLTDTELYDTTGTPIVHDVYHGMFIGLIRDIAVVSLVPDLDFAYEGWMVNVNVTVKNKGNLTETFDVKIYIEGSFEALGTVTDLPPNEETTITIVWDTAGEAPCHNYTISAMAGPVPYEINTGDNSLTDGTVKIRIMGDINGDGTVDMRDIGLICDSYGAFLEDPRYSVYVDLNRDERVDLRDIGICCFNYLRSC